MQQRESEWIEWAGGECPIAEDELVETRARDGFTSVNPGHQTTSLWRGDAPESVA